MKDFVEALFDALRTFTAKQWMAVITIAGGCIAAYTWVENRYASKETEEMILQNIIRVDSKISALISTQYSQEQIEKIDKSAKHYEEQMRRYMDAKK
jgi:hypothetical protein